MLTIPHLEQVGLVELEDVYIYRSSPWSNKKAARGFDKAREKEDVKSIVPQAPFAGFGYVVRDSEFLSDLAEVFNLYRLWHILQLAFLHDPVGKEDGGSLKGVSYQFPHTRYLHTIDVLAHYALILHRLGIRSRTGIVAALTHDILTPAGGDTIKQIDPDLFDEDANYPLLLKDAGWPMFRDKYGIDENMLVETILNRGVLGQILDIADKSAFRRPSHVWALGVRESLW
jgi:hypothetical protein